MAEPGEFFVNQMVEVPWGFDTVCGWIVDLYGYGDRQYARVCIPMPAGGNLSSDHDHDHEEGEAEDDLACLDSVPYRLSDLKVADRSKCVVAAQAPDNFARRS